MSFYEKGRYDLVKNKISMIKMMLCSNGSSISMGS